MNLSDRHKPIVVIIFLLMVGLNVSVFIEIGSVVGRVFSTWSGVLGGAMGLGIAGFINAHRKTFRFDPFVRIIFFLISFALYFLLRSLLVQLDSVELPPYLPTAWITAICTCGMGLLVGSGIPLLLQSMVIAGYDLLE